MIEVRNLHKSFETQQVLTDISCTFRPGCNNMIIGRSGSGKTVLMKCLIGLYRPDAGEILFDGRDVMSMTREEVRHMREEIGVLFQGAALFDSMTVADNVAFPLRMFSNMTTREQARRVRFCLDRVNIKDSDRKYPSQLSGGMQKRVAIARAIALNPRYLFCDEPNSGLDPQTSIIIDQLIDDITREYGITTVVNTHDMNSLIGIGQNIIFLSEGQVAWQGDRDSLLSTDNVALQDFIFASPIMKKWQMAK